ncbi:pyridoxamine 5'-phosphate oxidase family protein [Streptomyces sp. NPDC005065]|uniref:pyridoxamine 5'-phosphate oxidase family protein n=1 Tax=Streptomyces sp. NPDC005065 TaxID=3154461 RepID=UPI0033AD4FCF
MRNEYHSPTSYHNGELAAQERAGFRFEASRIEPIISGAIPRGADRFLASQKLLIIGASDVAGDMWASVLYGRPGFVTVPDPRTLLVAAEPVTPDPLAGALRQPSRVGTLAIDFPTRRRFRINGRSTPTSGGLQISVDQAYGNCPQYIQQRIPGEISSAQQPVSLSSGTSLTPREQISIAEADTFFVASASTAGDADVSHRGGNPGFVKILGPNRLKWPDYSGNKMLMTLGNFSQNPAAGLLFIDWTNGNSLHLTGGVEIEWEQSAKMPGAERSVIFTVKRTVQVSHDEAPDWSRPHFSRFNPPAN